MAHDITFTTKPEKETVYFFGYMEGIFYSVFECTHFDKGISGSNESIEMDREEVFIKLEKIKESEEQKRYPDSNRFPNFYEEMKKTKGEKFETLFS